MAAEESISYQEPFLMSFAYIPIFKAISDGNDASPEMLSNRFWLMFSISSRVLQNRGGSAD